ncbi:MAG: SRPBCC domain-containing protein [Boseongicola sp.]|nr:SRPBCC domain-containing protein [Boseongicola sp.]
MINFDPERDLRIEQFIKASPETIWRCWQEPELFKQWFTPPGVEVTEVINDVRSGGRAFVVMKLPDGALMPSEGCFLHAEYPNLLVYSDAVTVDWRPASEPFMTAVVELTPRDGGTLYCATVLHRDEKAREKHEGFGFYDGWGTTLKQLSDLAKTL